MIYFLDNLYVTDSFNYSIRKIALSTSVITTYAGTGSANYNGDGGVASSAALNVPKGVAVDSSGKE